MIRIKELLVESINGPEVISESEAKKIYNNEASDYDIEADQTIFRGVSHLPENTEFAKVDPTRWGFQGAKMESNYYKLVQDLSNPWEDYPQRKIFCSTNKSYANDYGELFVVVPYDNTDWGICPTLSNWASFPRVEEFLGAERPDPRVFNHFVKVVTKDFLGEIPDQNSFDDLKIKLNEVGDLIEDLMIKDIKDKKYSHVLRRWLISKVGEKYDQLSKFLFNVVMGPEKNGFEYQNSWKGTGNNREVWTDGPCLYINANIRDFN